MAKVLNIKTKIHSKITFLNILAPNFKTPFICLSGILLTDTSVKIPIRKTGIFLIVKKNAVAIIYAFHICV